MNSQTITNHSLNGQEKKNKMETKKICGQCKHILQDHTKENESYMHYNFYCKTCETFTDGFGCEEAENDN